MRYPFPIPNTTTVRPTSDNPDLPSCPAKRVPAASASGVVTKYRRDVFTDATLTICEHTMRAPRLLERFRRAGFDVDLRGALVGALRAFEAEQVDPGAISKVHLGPA
jgi:hypothetical protein